MSGLSSDMSEYQSYVFISKENKEGITLKESIILNFHFCTLLCYTIEVLVPLTQQQS
jgi:hypothetical protein